MKKLIIICTCLAVAAMSVAEADAQDYKSLRTKTWSIYGQGGVSWATGLDFKNVDPTRAITIAPEFGAGVNYNLRPWIRLGLNYEFSKYNREQRFSEFQELPSLLVPSQGITDLVQKDGGTIYRDMWTMYHNADLTFEFNLAELKRNRRSGRFNLYAGVGVGYMFANGNLYDLGMGFERWEDPSNYQNDLQVKDNWQSLAWVNATNTRHDFKSLYIPASLSAEYDVSPRLTLGVKGQYRHLISCDAALAPKGVVAAAFVVRYNFVGKKYRTHKQKYNDLTGQYAALQSQYDASVNDAGRSKAAMDRLNAENDALRRQLANAPEPVAPAPVKAAPESINILFPVNTSIITAEGRARLEAVAQELKADRNATINLIGEASADGETDANQKLSEERLATVIAILKELGIGSERIKSGKAIGDSEKVSQRRVEITISK